MKKQDLLTMIVVGIVSLTFSVFLSGRLLNGGTEKKQETEKITPITSDFPQLSSKYYNDMSVNPTKLIQIGQGENTKPFENAD
jgi:hypothetical protein